MAIDFDTIVAFPTNVVDIIVARLNLIDTRLHVMNRGLRKMDPNLSIGVYPESWQPVNDTEEFLGLGVAPTSLATLSEYFIQIHTMTKGADQVLCQRQHSLLARVVRDILEFDQPFRVALTSLPGVTVNGKTEFFKEFKALTQAYFPLDDASASFINIGALRCKITTETKIC